MWHEGHLCVCVLGEKGHVSVPVCVGVYSYEGIVRNHRGQRSFLISFGLILCRMCFRPVVLHASYLLLPSVTVTLRQVL